ncbi:MAG: Glu/Leu/Phe/Val dehydrogenase [Halanaerobium sp.]|nr:Glu/Leu/Phe/Val dehydrogenase [Halanaerobium sp.]
MEIFKKMKEEGHEQVIFCQEKRSGLKAIIAIHNTVLGPALGGCRMWDYKTEDDALNDALRLSKGMTYKSGAAGTDFGGGKTVIIGDPKKDKSEALLRALGRYIDGLDGRYSTGTDVGTTYDDFVVMKKETEHVGALPKEYGGSGNSAITTAYGVWKGIKACCKHRYGDPSLAGKTVAIQGVGKVGSLLVDYLVDEGAEKIYITDINQDYINRVTEKHDVEVVGTDEIYDVECDIFSPNALGAVINDDTIGRFKCDIIAGAANNVLARPEHGDMLEEKGILYAPDYVINAGGLIQVADEFEPGGYREERTLRKTDEIYNRLLEIFELGEKENIPTYKAADLMVERRLEDISIIKRVQK